MAHTLSLGDVEPIGKRHFGSKLEAVKRRFPEAHAKMAQRLQEITAASDAINADPNTPVPYRYFHPDKLAPSIAI